MTSALTHRGPSDEGYWCDDNGEVTFGHRRLSILDLSPAGHQPMLSSGGRWVLAFNGEIYNFRELRRQLEGVGIHFRGHSDTEVLVEGIQQWGLDKTLSKIEGMFALALWDRQDHELHLVRDRFGEKPLYFGWIGNRFAFASELKAFRRMPGFSPEIDRDAIALYLRHNCVPAPKTVYCGVEKLLPGSVATIGRSSKRGGQTTQRAYWSAMSTVEHCLEAPNQDSPIAITRQLEELLASSVRERMVADVPIGAFLSGGIDSSLIVALMQRASSRPIRTFTIGFADRSFDESLEAAAVAAHLGTQHTALVVSDDDAAAVIAEIPGIWDEPFGDASQIPTLLVSRLAKSDVTVALTGDAGDELFAGYNRHAWLQRIWSRADKIPKPIRQAVGSRMERLPQRGIDVVDSAVLRLPARWRLRNPGGKVVKLGKVISAEDPQDAYRSLTSLWDEAESIVLGAQRVLPGPWDVAQWPAGMGVTEQLLLADTIGYLPNDILTKVDRASMATSLETRMPFLDRRVFEFAWRIPMELKLRHGTTKWVLRELLSTYVPTELTDRPKMGFGLPVGKWLRGSLRPWADDLLDPQRLLGQGLLDPIPIRHAWELHRDGRRDFSHELWSVLMLQAWIEQWGPAASG